MTNYLKEFLSQYDSAETRRAYLRDVNRFMEAHGPISRVTRVATLAYVNELKELELSAASIHRLVSAVRSYFKFLVINDVIVKGPWEGIRLPRINIHYKEALSRDELRSMVDACQGYGKADRDLVILTLGIYNGLRREEMCGLNYGDILEEGKLVEIRGKGDKVRTIPLHEECLKAIVSYLKCEDRTKGHPGAPVLRGPRGERIDAQAVYHAMKRIAKKAGIDRSIHPHMLRSAFASMALESGQPISSVAQDMGHSSIETTFRYDRSRSKYDRSTIPLIKPV